MRVWWSAASFQSLKMLLSRVWGGQPQSYLHVSESWRTWKIVTFSADWITLLFVLAVTEWWRCREYILCWWGNWCSGTSWGPGWWSFPGRSGKTPQGRWEVTGWWGQARLVHNISSTELQVVVAARGQSSTYSYTDSSSEGRRCYLVEGIYYLLVLPPLDLLLHFAETLCISSQNVWFHVQNMWVQLLQHLSECVGHILETTDGVWKNLFTFRLNFPPCIRISYLISSQLLLSSCTHFISLSFFYL